MKQADGRHSPAAVQAEKRRVAFRMKVLGYAHTEIATVLDVNVWTVQSWFSRAKQAGEAAVIMGGKRGKPVGVGRKLTNEQAEQIRADLLRYVPDELNLGFTLWTYRLVQQLIWQQYQLSLPDSTVRLYLKRWGLIPPKSQSEPQWLQQDYPALAERVKTARAPILWINVQRIPLDKCPSGMIFVLKNQGRVHFMLYEEPFSHEVLVRFLQRLLNDFNRKVILVIDAALVKNEANLHGWLAAFKLPVELCCLAMENTALKNIHV